MSKRPADSLHSDRPLKLQNNAPQTLEFLGEECLPVEHADISRALAADIRAYFPNGVNWYDLAVCYGILQARCPDLFEPFDSASVKDFFVMQMKELWPLLEEAYKTNNYKQIILIKQFRRPDSYSLGTAARKMETSRAVKDAQHAWGVPFIGDAHNALAANLRDMYTEAIAPKTRDTLYMFHAAIIQSSGSGKSRMVDEVSKLIFTIPFNIRETKDTTEGAWPPPDESIRDLFVQEFGTRFSEDQLALRILCFFQAAFERIEGTISTHCNSVSQDRAAFALGWHQYLAHGRNRADLYKDIVARTVVLMAPHASMAPDARPELEVAARLETATVHALRKLVTLVCRLSRCSLDGSPLDGTRPEESATQGITQLHVFIYFDEAHVLTERQLRESDKYPFDVLVKTLNSFRGSGAFTVFLSTQSDVEQLAPSGLVARSARYRRLVGNMHAPITETPFDCFGPRRLNPSRLKAADVDRVELMACFGRPLWRSILSTECSATLDEYSKKGNDNVVSSEDLEVQAVARAQNLIELACLKLLCSLSTKNALETYTNAAQTAILDARIMLSYEASRLTVQRHVEQLVASHMRTVYSIPQSREYIRSGYSSEPILAEAAARQLFTWRTQRNLDIYPGPEVSILKDNLEHDLLSRGEIGEAVGRLLLILARDQAAVDSSIGSPNLTFSNHVSVEAFFNALLPNEAAQRVLNCSPDNQVLDQNSKPFREMYKDAVLNFTHFAKWADDSAMTEDSAVGCFIRHMAVICRNNAAIVDVFIPILMDKTAFLGPEVMSGIFVQFKLRQEPGSYSAYAIDEKKVGFFSPNVNEKTLRPYITLIMELGVTHPPSLLATTPTDYWSKVAKDNREKIAQGKTGGTRDAQGSPSKMHIPSPPTRGHLRKAAVHPRFSMYINGCSPSVYKVISERDRLPYKTIIRSGDLLGEHPRQDRKTLSLVRNQKPFFALGHMYWHWIQNKVLNVDEPSPDSEEEAMYIQIPQELAYDSP